jgi:hypothetical protein
MQMVLVISLPLVALVVIIAVILCIICRWSRARSVLRYGLGFFFHGRRRRLLINL